MFGHVVPWEVSCVFLLWAAFKSLPFPGSLAGHLSHGLHASRQKVITRLTSTNRRGGTKYLADFSWVFRIWAGKLHFKFTVKVLWGSHGLLEAYHLGLPLFRLHSLSTNYIVVFKIKEWTLCQKLICHSRSKYLCYYISECLCVCLHAGLRLRS